MCGSPVIALAPACPLLNTREIHLLAWYKSACLAAVGLRTSKMRSRSVGERTKCYVCQALRLYP